MGVGVTLAQEQSFPDLSGITDVADQARALGFEHAALAVKIAQLGEDPLPVALRNDVEDIKLRTASLINIMGVQLAESDQLITTWANLCADETSCTDAYDKLTSYTNLRLIVTKRQTLLQNTLLLEEFMKHATEKLTDPL